MFIEGAIIFAVTFFSFFFIWTLSMPKVLIWLPDLCSNLSSLFSSHCSHSTDLKLGLSWLRLILSASLLLHRELLSFMLHYSLRCSQMRQCFLTLMSPLVLEPSPFSVGMPSSSKYLFQFIQLLGKLSEKLLEEAASSVFSYT